MVRTLLIIAAASFVLMLVSFAGAAALGGPELLRGGWAVDLSDWDNDGHASVDWSGPSVERTLEWSGTDTLTLALPADVTFTQGDETSVVVRGPEGVVQRVTLVDGRLSLPDGDGDDNRITILGRDEDLSVQITAPDVSRFILDGYGDLTLNNLDRETLEIQVAGAGDVDLEGLVAQTADIRIAGAGGAEVRAVESAHVVIMGVGNVDLVQRPARLTQEITGVGAVQVAGEE
jgi:hypothetical protein